MEDPKKLAEDHVSWFLETIKPLLITHMIHGYKHGFNDAREEYIQRENSASEFVKLYDRIGEHE